MKRTRTSGLIILLFLSLFNSCGDKDNGDDKSLGFYNFKVDVFLTGNYKDYRCGVSFNSNTFLYNEIKKVNMEEKSVVSEWINWPLTGIFGDKASISTREKTSFFHVQLFAYDEDYSSNDTPQMQAQMIVYQDGKKVYDKTHTIKNGAAGSVDTFGGYFNK